METKTASVTPFAPDGRTCLVCGEPLPRYHRGDICKKCQASEREPDDLDREIEEVAHTMTERGEKTMGAIVNGIKLVPDALASPHCSAWAQVVEQFLKLGLDCVRLENIPGRADRNEAPEGLRKAVKGRGCRAAFRKGKVYLIRTDR
ncbi:MAG: hypothetical protein JXA57_17765 [Armatimonadetes bacterium]|nr:hypothetical protein [Armatimonadota bacterium]